MWNNSKGHVPNETGTGVQSVEAWVKAQLHIVAQEACCEATEINASPDLLSFQISNDNRGYRPGLTHVTGWSEADHGQNSPYDLNPEDRMIQ